MSTPFPTSDHCDGRRFFNPTQVHEHSFREVLKWQSQRAHGQGTAWPKSAPPPRAPSLVSPVAAGHLAITFIGHATFLLQLPGLNVLTDPVFSARVGLFGLIGPRRVRPPALSLAQLPPIDVVLLSHNHYDHLDLASLQWLARERRPRLIAPLGLGAWLGARAVANVTELDWWQSNQPAVNLTVTCTPAQHWSSRWPWDRGRTLWGGYWLGTPGLAVYFCGDSGWCPHFAEIRQRFGSPDLAVLPIGAYAPRWFMQPMHMNPEEAVRAHLALGARRSVGMHFGTFQLSDEGIDEPRRDLATARRQHNLAEADFDTLDFGETRLLPEK